MLEREYGVCMLKWKPPAPPRYRKLLIPKYLYAKNLYEIDANEKRIVPDSLTWMDGASTYTKVCHT